MAITPPTERIWWNLPVARSEIIWVIVAFTWGLVMFSAMVYWHLEGEQNLSNEAYRITPEAYMEKATAMVEQYQVGEEAGMPVVHPPPGSDVYLVARTPHQAAMCISLPDSGSGGPLSSSRKISPTGCISPPWTGCTGSRCNRSTSTWRSIPVMTWSSR